MCKLVLIGPLTVSWLMFTFVCQASASLASPDKLSLLSWAASAVRINNETGSLNPRPVWDQDRSLNDDKHSSSSSREKKRRKDTVAREVICGLPCTIRCE